MGDPREVLRTGTGFVFVDRVLGKGEGWLESEWTVAGPEGYFRGDGEQRFLPATFQLEHAVQTGELLIHELYGRTPDQDGEGVVARFRNVRCRQMVLPGDLLQTRVELVEQLGPAYELKATVRREGAKVLEARLVYTATAAAAQVGV